MTTQCRHCGNRIVRHNTALGPTWYHQPAGAAFMDGAERGCPSLTVAEPWPSDKGGNDT